MRSKTKIALIPLLLALAACTAIDTKEAPPVARDQNPPNRHGHEHEHREHEQHRQHEHKREHDDARHQHQHDQQHQHGQTRHQHQHQPEPASRGNHTHQHASAPAQSSGAAPQIWETDAPLREGMRRIRAALHTLEAARADGLSSSETSEFAAQIDTQVAFLIDNCKLQPQADAALHTIIADLVGAAQSLKSDPAKLDVLASMHAALQRYARQFNDPEWRGVRPAIAK